MNEENKRPAAAAADSREARYLEACAMLEQAKNSLECRDASKAFERLGDYRDSADMAKRCLERGTQLTSAAHTKQIRQKKARGKIWKKLLIALAAVLVALGGLMLLVFKVLLPASYYNKAEKKLAAGEIAQAASLFGRAGNYRDARDRSFSLWNRIAQRRTISAGDRYAAGIRRDGTAVVCAGQDADLSAVDSWTELVDISCGPYHIVGLRSDGTVVATKPMDADSKYDDDERKGQVEDWTDIVQIDAGRDHTVGLRTDGTVVAAGIGVGCAVLDWSGIVAISAGYHHTVGLCADGTVVVTVPDQESRKYNLSFNYQGVDEIAGWTDMVAVSAGCSHTVGLRSDGTVAATMMTNQPFLNVGQCQVDRWTDIVQIDAGWDHTVGLRSDGTVVAVGSNEYGQCKVGDWRDIVAVSAGAWCTVGLRSDGTVLVAGGIYNKTDADAWTDIRLPD